MLTQRTKRAAKSKAPSFLYPYGVDDLFSVEHVGGNTWILRLITPIIQTGAAVVNTYRVEFYHTLMEFDINHMVAAGTDSTDPLDFTWETLVGNSWVVQFSTTSNTYASLVLSMMDEGGRAYAGTSHRVTTNSTATDLVQLTIKLVVNKA